MYRDLIKVLKVPNAEGETVGDNWWLASFGTSSIDNAEYHLTTDTIRCSEYADLSEVLPLDPKQMAEFMAEKLNDAWQRYWEEKHQLKLFPASGSGLGGDQGDG